MAAGNESAGALDRGRVRRGAEGLVRADVRPLEPGRQLAPRARRASAAIASCHARQRGAALGNHARAIKLGAVLIPASNLLTPEDLRDRMSRGEVKHVIAGAANTGKFADARRRLHPCVRRHADRRLEELRRFDGGPADYAPDGATKASDPLILYFTSGTTSKPKLVLHTHQSYPVGHLSTMYWIGIRPNDIHLNISSPGWAKHAWSCFFAPWNAGACIFIYNYARFNAKAMLGVLEKFQVTTMCAPPTVWRMMIQEDLAAYRGRLKIRELIGAGEPLNPEIIDRIQSAWGITIRDGFGQTRNDRAWSATRRVSA